MPPPRPAGPSTKKKRAPPADAPPMQILQFDPQAKKPRKRTTRAQQAVLERVYAADDKPGRARRDALCAALGREWSQRDVQVWFQNRRAKTKKMREKERRGGASRSAERAAKGESPADTPSPAARASPPFQLIPAPAAHPAAYPDGQSCSEPHLSPSGASPPSSASPPHAPSPHPPLDAHRRGSLPVLPAHPHADAGEGEGQPPGFDPAARRRSAEETHTLRHVRMLAHHPFAGAVRVRNERLYPAEALPAPADALGAPHAPGGALGALSADGALGVLPEPGYSFGTPHAGLHELAPDALFAYALDGACKEEADDYGAGFTARRGSIASTSTLRSDSTTSRRSSMEALDGARRASVASATSMFADMNLRGRHSAASSRPSSRRASSAQYAPAPTGAQAYMQSTLGGIFAPAPAQPAPHPYYAERAPDFFVQVPKGYAAYHHEWNNPAAYAGLEPIYEMQATGAIELGGRECVAAPEPDAGGFVPPQGVELFEPVQIPQALIVGEMSSMFNFP